MSLRGYSRSGPLERRAGEWWRHLRSRAASLPGVARLDALLEPLRWPERWRAWNRGPLATLAPAERVMAIAIAMSVLLHAVLLVIHFQFPDAKRLIANQPLEVVLVNSRSSQKPVTPDALAQANLDGGGNTDENRRAKTPLPVMPKNAPSSDLQQAQRRVQELEALQRQLLTQTLPRAPEVTEAPATQPAPEVKSPMRGIDLRNQALNIPRLEAQIARNVDEYNKRPRKNFVGARASEYRFAQYTDAWREKVERIGNINYPQEARGKLYGSLILEVSVRADGDIESVYVLKSSGQTILDRAAERIVRMAAPYAPFPPDLRRDTDILVITRTWHFAQGDRMFGE